MTIDYEKYDNFDEKYIYQNELFLKAIEENNLNLFYHIIDNGFDIQWQNNEALLQAAKFGRFQMVQELLHLGADVNDQNYEILFFAALSDNIELVDFVYKSGWKGDTEDIVSYMNILNAQHKNQSFIYLLNLLPIETQKKFLTEFCIKAAENDNFFLFKFLNQSFFLDDDILKESIFSANQHQSFQTLQYLMPKLNLNYDDLHFLLLQSIAHGNQKIVEYYMIDFQYSHLQTEHYAQAQKSNQEQIFYLLLHLDKNKKNSLTEQLLYNCIYYHQKNIFDSLLQEGLTYQKHIHQFLLDSIENRDEYFSLFFIKKGANIQYENNMALIKAIEKNFLPIIDKLLDSGANVYDQNNKPLELMFQSKNPKLMKMFLDRNISIPSSIIEKLPKNSLKESEFNLFLIKREEKIKLHEELSSQNKNTVKKMKI